jgi:uncharacterized protein (TIGR03437 family)
LRIRPGRVHCISPGQINVRIPWELQGLSSAQMKVSSGVISTAVYRVRLNDYSPEIFQYPLSSGLAAALNQDHSMIGVNNPVARGETARVYANGLGPLDGEVADGEPAPLSPLLLTRDIPTVTIGGQPAVALFHGHTPASIGLYQMDVVVPTGISAGVVNM